MESDIFTITIGGSAGQGIKSAGLMLSKLASRSGYFTCNYIEYPSLIRGGHNVMQINISKTGVSAPCKKINLLIALNQETIDKHLQQLVQAGGILFDSEDSMDVSKSGTGIKTYGIPMSKIATDAGGKELLINTVSLGAITALLGGDLKILNDLIREEFSGKGKDTVRINQTAAEAGFDHMIKSFSTDLKKVLEPLAGSPPKIVLNGNDAVALGAIAGGMQFAAIYPMSPISGIIQTLALHQEKYGYIYKQPEDEISAVNMAIGASFAGVRSFTATSGGGFCLMTEGYGLAAMTETPLVIIEGMRPGPATGLATWSGQGDLSFVLNAHQGDFPRIVLAAGDAQEAFEQTMKAFNLAQKYQTPVVVLVDKNVCEDEQSFPVFDILSYQLEDGKQVDRNIPDYERFALSDDGISPRAIPGLGNFFIANSYEHDKLGFSTENIEDINSQMEKRMAKLKTCAKEDMEAPKLFGPKEADLTFISWGSNKGSIIQAIKDFPNVNFLHITWMSPFPKEIVKNILEKSRNMVDVECNFSAQLATLIKDKTGINITDKMLKYDGRPFFVEEIVEKIKSVLGK